MKSIPPLGPTLLARNLILSCSRWKSQGPAQQDGTTTRTSRQRERIFPKNPWTLQWRGVWTCIISRVYRVLKMTPTFEGSGFLGWTWTSTGEVPETPSGLWFLVLSNWMIPNFYNGEWWLNQPCLKNMLAKLDHLLRDRGENKNDLEPPPSFDGGATK